MISAELTVENRPACVPLDSVFRASAPKTGVVRLTKIIKRRSGLQTGERPRVLVLDCCEAPHRRLYEDGRFEFPCGVSACQSQACYGDVRRTQL